MLFDFEQKKILYLLGMEIREGKERDELNFNLPFLVCFLTPLV
jgi:hypothetical protein